MSATAFGQPANNIVATVGSGGYTAASGTLALTAGQGAQFPALTSGWFYRITVVQQGVAYSPTITSSNYTIFKATSLTTDTFHGVIAIEGTTDRNYVSGDAVDVRTTSGTIGDLQTAVNSLETTYGNQGISYGTSNLPTGSSPYVITGSAVFQAVNPSNWRITIPAAGTYMVILNLRYYLSAASASSDATAWIVTQLYNATASAYVANTLTLGFYQSIHTTNASFEGTVSNSYFLTFSGSAVIEVYASQNYTGTSPTIATQVLSDTAGVSTLSYVRLA